MKKQTLPSPVEIMTMNRVQFDNFREALSNKRQKCWVCAAIIRVGSESCEKCGFHRLGSAGSPMYDAYCNRGFDLDEQETDNTPESERYSRSTREGI